MDSEAGPVSPVHLGPISPPDSSEASEGSKDTDFAVFQKGLWAENAGEEHNIPPDPATSTKSDLPAASRPVSARASSRRATNRRPVPSDRPYRGRYVRPTAFSGSPSDLAWDAIIRKAAPYQRTRPPTHDRAITLYPDDLLKRMRFQNPQRLLLLVCDSSGSMGTELMGLAKRTALAVLERVYIRRDQVAMLAFRDKSAELLFPPTNQAELVQRAMVDLPCGGTTPLSRALELAVTTLHRALSRSPELGATLLLISDGRANVGNKPGEQHLLEEIDFFSQQLTRFPRLRRVFLDTTEKGKNDYPARFLSERLDAERHILHKILSSGKDPALEIARALG